jgi:poly(ADP-ribose) glycohydrolase ARH3
MMMTDIKAKFLGSMVASALGDAIGELAFRYRGKESLISQLEQLPELSYTDDTAMAIGIAESITDKGYLDQQDLGERLRYNFQKEPWRGYGPGPPTVFSIVEREGIRCTEAAQTLYGGKGSFGNGAAMRIAPVGLFFHKSRVLYEKASLSAAVTHTHSLGKDGGAVQAKAVSLAVNLDPTEAFPHDEFIKNLVGFTRTVEMKEKMLMVQKLIADDVLPSHAADYLGRSVAVHESLPFALYSFIRHVHSFEDCLFCAILNGGDRDTLGAMAGAVSGAYLGIESIPRTWRHKLENGSHIESLAIKLSEIESNS